MKPTKTFKIVLVTAPDMKTARRLARAALKAKLIACANLVPKVESHYWWQGKLERGSEVLMILKATRRTLPQLEKLILQLHPYDTAEFIVLPLNHGSARYLAWWDKKLPRVAARLVGQSVPPAETPQARRLRHYRQNLCPRLSLAALHGLRQSAANTTKTCYVNRT